MGFSLAMILNIHMTTYEARVVQRLMTELARQYRKAQIAESKVYQYRQEAIQRGLSHGYNFEGGPCTDEECDKFVEDVMKEKRSW